MRHEYHKKGYFGNDCQVLLMLSLTGCGQGSKASRDCREYLSGGGEGRQSSTSYLVNTFDKDFYNLDGLTQMVEEEAEEFNATHTEASRDIP